MKNVIELNNVTYYYRNCQEPALSNISTSVTKGAAVAIIGHTGAGKTTLNLCLNGLIPQFMEGVFTGQVMVNGQDVNQIGVQFIAKQIGLVLDDPEGQIVGRTVWEDVSFGPSNFGLSVAETEQRVMEALRLVQLEELAHRETSQLSGGEKQRLVIASILALSPEILVLDEPASELDPLVRDKIYATIDHLRATKHFTLLVTEHNPEDIITRVDQVKVLLRGELAWEGKPELLFRNLPLLEEYGLRPVPVCRIGWEFYQRGWLPYNEIPLNVKQAELRLRSLFERKQVEYKALATVAAQNIADHIVLEVSGLCHEYTLDQPALKAVDFSVRQGEFIALVGPNGSGKTTLAKHFNGLLKPSQGKVIVNGHDTRRTKTSLLAGEVGYVFQNPDHQLFSATVEAELQYGLKQQHLSEAEMNVRIEEVLAVTELTALRHKHPLSLGKGERQLVAVASILVLRPKILVIDEPTTGLDWVGTQRLMGLIERLHAEGTTIIMISHDMELVARYAQRLVVMKAGNIYLDGPVRQIFGKIGDLEQAGIVPPQCVRLAVSLKDLGVEDIWLNEDECLQALMPCVEEGLCL